MFSTADADERLDAPRWRLPRPRRPTLLRAGLVAALLCLAAGVLLLGDTPGPAPSIARVAPSHVTATPRPGPPAGTVGLPLRLADAGVASVVRPGQRVDVLAAAEEGRPAQVVATGVLVLRAQARGDAPEDGTLLYLAVTPEQAVRVASETETHMTVTVRSP